MIPSPHPRSFLAYLTLLLAAPLPLGSNRDWAWPLLSAAVFLLVAQVSLGHEPISTPARRQLWLLILLAGWMLMQITGLPLLLEPVTLEIASTRDELLKTLSYAGFAYLTLQLVRSTRSAAWVIRCLLAGAAVQVAVELYQLLELSMSSRSGRGLAAFRATGTYASPNHLAGHLHQVLGLALGLLLFEHAAHAAAPWRRQLLEFLTGPGLRLRLLVLMLAAGLVMTLSRGGNAAFLSALVLTTVVAALARRRLSMPLLMLALSVIIVDVALIGRHYGVERLQERVANTELRSEFRVELVPFHMDMIRDQIATGSGAGTYEALFASDYRDATVPARLTHAENDYVQFLVELGAPGGLLLALFLLGAIRQQWLLLGGPAPREKRALVFGCMLATTAMLVHAFVDFNLRIPANALLFLLALTVPFGLGLDRTGAPDGRGAA